MLCLLWLANMETVSAANIIKEYSTAPNATLAEMGYTIEKDVNWYEGTVNGVSFLPDGYVFGSGVDALSYTAADNGIILNGYGINQCTNKGLEWFYLQLTSSGITCEPGVNGLRSTKNERWIAINGLKANQIIAVELTDVTETQFVVNSTDCSNKTGWSDALTDPLQVFEITDSIHNIQELAGNGISNSYRFFRVNPAGNGWMYAKFNGKSPNNMLQMQIWSPKQDDNDLVYNGGFEDWTTTSVPTGWEGWQIAEKSNTGGATIQQSTDRHSGYYSCFVQGAASNKRLATRKITLSAGTYVASFWAKSDNGCVIKPGMATVQANGSVSYNYGDYANEGISLTPSWEQYSYEFTLNEETDVSMIILNYKNTGDCYIDDYCLSSKSIVPNINYIPNQLVNEEYNEGDTIVINGKEWCVGPNLIDNASFDANPAYTDGKIVEWTNGTYSPMTTSTFLWYPTGGYDGGAYIQANKHTGAAGDGSIGQRWTLEPNSYYYFSFWLSNNSANNQYIPAISLTANESTLGGRNERTDIEDDGPTSLNSGCLIGKNGETSAKCLGYANFIDKNGDGYGEWTQTGMVFKSEEYTYLQFNARWLKEGKIQACFDGFQLHKLYSLQSSPSITFADATVKLLCVQNWDKDGDGELSEIEAAAVDDLKNVFQGNTSIKRFEELVYFVGLTAIGSSTFSGCTALTSIKLPSKILSIENNAFFGCSSLASITIPNSVTSIGDEAFSGCSSLSSIEIPASVSSIGTNTFYGCNQLKKVTINSNTLLSKDYSSYYSYRLYDCFGNQVEELIIGESVSSIGNYAFYNGTSSSSKIKSITLPNSVKKVGDYAFYECNYEV